MDIPHVIIYSMNYTTLTYNLHYNKASQELRSVLRDCDPDIVFLQELTTDEESMKTIMDLGYELADFSNSFVKGKNIYGVATFYRSSLIELQKTKSFNIPSSVIQIITFLLKNRSNPRTVLRTDFIIKKNKVPLCAYNIHFSPNATNALRIKQLNNTLNDLTVPKKDPLIIAGDFNYPYGRRKLEEILGKHHLLEATNNVFYTSRQTFFKRFALKLKLDYVFYRNLTLISNKRVEVFHSDHFPILSKFEL